MSNKLSPKLSPKELYEIEQAYAQVAFGYDEPSIMWANGQSLIDMAAKAGESVTQDSYGQPINPALCYVISDKGIFIYDPQER